ENGLLESVRDLFTRLLGHVKDLDRHVTEVEQQILQWHKRDERSRKLEQVPGIGPITTSALVASIGDARASRHGRQLAAWVGLVRGNIPLAESPACTASVNAAISTCVRY